MASTPTASVSRLRCSRSSLTLPESLTFGVGPRVRGLGIGLVLVMVFGLMRGLRIATRIASSLAILGVLMRVLLPALHTHASGHHHASSTHAAVATVCGCCAMHGFVGGDDRSQDRDEVTDSSARFHHCTACEIEVGIPCGCPPSSDLIIERHHCIGCAVFESVAILVASKIRLAQPRAPPSQRI